MKKIALLLVLLCSMFASAQEDNVRIYIRADDVSAFDVRHTFSDVHSIELPAHAALALLNNPRVHIVGVATRYELEAKPAPTSRSVFPSDQTPWGIQTVYNNATLTSTSGGDGVNVAVLDTGAKTNHLDLKNRIAQCKDFTRNGIRNGCADSNGHGTHTAGTIAADGGSDGKGIYGVAPQARLFTYKVCSNFCWSDDIHATDQGANIISMSLGGSALAQIERDALDYAVANDVLVIAAAGNSGPAYDTIEYPGAYHKVVAVAALDSSLSVASFSSRGVNDADGIVEDREVEIAMPGVAVESTWNNGGYNTISGTSMATPHASGLAAKFWQGNAADTRLWLQNNAVDITAGSLAAVGDDPASGFGMPRVQ
jgi:subtilisin